MMEIAVAGGCHAVQHVAQSLLCDSPQGRIALDESHLAICVLIEFMCLYLHG
jgi:hypothetical protein